MLPCLQHGVRVSQTHLETAAFKDVLSAHRLHLPAVEGCFALASGCTVLQAGCCGGAPEPGIALASRGILTSQKQLSAR